MKKFSLFIMTFCYSIIGVSAAITVNPPAGINLTTNNNVPGDIIANIIQYFILITGILAVMAITWGGIKFALSTGDDEKMKKARYTVIYAFVGLVVAGLAYSIVEIITKIEL